VGFLFKEPKGFKEKYDIIHEEAPDTLVPLISKKSSNNEQEGQRQAHDYIVIFPKADESILLST
jgi:hypothetical protein